MNVNELIAQLLCLNNLLVESYFYAIKGGDLSVSWLIKQPIN